MDQVKRTWASRCRAEVDAECQQQSIHFVWLVRCIGYISSVEIYIFEWFWLSGGSFWAEKSTPEPALRDGRPKSCKMYRKVWKLDGPGLHLGALWSSMGAAGESLDELGNSFGLNLGSAGNVFSRICWKSVICVFRRQSAAESPVLQVPAPKLQPLGWKSLPRSVHGSIEKILHTTCTGSMEGSLWDLRNLLENQPFQTPRRLTWAILGGGGAGTHSGYPYHYI